MKKQKKQLLILLILLLICVLGYVLLGRYQAKVEEEEAAESAGETIFTVDTDTITEFSYIVDGVTYHYEKSEDDWTCEEEPDLTLDASQITTLLSDLAEITCDDTLSDVEDYDTYGFNDPSNVIEFQTEDGEAYSITIGDYNQTAYCYYYMTNLSEDVYVGNAGVCTSFADTPDTYQATEDEDEVSENTTGDDATDDTTDDDTTADTTDDDATDDTTDDDTTADTTDDDTTDDTTDDSTAE